MNKAEPQPTESDLVAEIRKHFKNKEGNDCAPLLLYDHEWQEVLALVEPVIRAKVEEGYREIVEIYAGMDGFIPETAPEGYQQKIIRDMYEIAANKLRK